MSVIRVNVVLFGVGNIGSELLSQVIESQRFFLKKRNIDLRFPIITNSTIAFFEEEGFRNKWEADFTKLSVPYKFQDILNYVKEKKLEITSQEMEIDEDSGLPIGKIMTKTRKKNAETVFSIFDLMFEIDIKFI